MRFALALALFLAGIVSAAPSFAESVRGNGNLKTEQRAATGFTGVVLSLPAKVEVRQGAAESVTVEADENLLPLIETTVRGSSLEIKPVRRNLSLDARSMRIVVQARQIDHLDIAGSGSMSSDAIRSQKLKLAISGSGSVEVRKLEADRVDASIAGSGNLKLAGGARTLDASIAGSGSVHGPGLMVDEAEFDIAGSGAAQLSVRKTLDVTVVGAGSVAYYGDPSVKRSIMGSGAIKRMGPLPQ